MRPRYHVLVCTNTRAADAGLPSCGPNGGARVLAELLTARAARSLYYELFITETRCLGVCPTEGTTVVVYPEGIWYVGVSPSDAREIFEQHLVGGRPVARLVDPRFA